MRPTPPNSTLKFLRWFCREDYLDEIEGDLIEIYETQYQNSPANAKRKLLWNTLRHLRPEFIKAFQFNHNSNTTTMIRHNLTLAIRNFKKYTGSLLINLAGLSTSIACVILVYLWVADEMSINKFHANEQRIYQVMQNLPKPGDSLTISGTAGILARELKNDFPEVEYASSVIPPEWFDIQKGIVNYEKQYLQARGQFAQPDYLNIFSWEILQGDRNQVLSDKYAVVISEEFATNLFGSPDNAVGKTIGWEQEDTEGNYQVSGIFRKPPANSTAQFDLLFNYQVYYERNKKNMDHWGNSNPDTYVLLKEGTNSAEFDQKIRNYVRQKFLTANGDEYLKYIGSLFIRPFSDAYLYNTYTNGQLTGGRIGYVKLFSLIAIFIIGIACINFINLTTARASRRAKEVGIKKTVGARRGSLVVQFLTESLLVTTLSMILGLIMVYLLLPNFNLLTGKALQLSIEPAFILVLMGLTVFVSMVSGIYPSVYLSHFMPASILKGNTMGKSLKSISENLIRRGLVIFQFSISIILIIAVVVVYQQIDLIQTKNLGYNDDNIIALKNVGRLFDESPVFIKEIKKIPGVQGASAFGHDLVGGVGGTSGVDWPGREPDEKVRFGNLEVDYQWIELLGIKVLEGRSFTDNYKAEEPNIIFNQAAIEAMGLEDPIGQTVKIWGEERQIVGVVDNFHFESLYEEVIPCFIQLYPDLTSVLIKIEPGRTAETISRLEAFHKDFNGGLPFDFTFLDDDYQKLYTAEKRVATLSNYFAGIAILISCLGLLALAAFTTEKRQKEIGIRKLLGSSVFNIVKLLSSDFIKMVVIAVVIALPVSYFFAEEWLSSFAYRVNLSWWWFGLSGAAALAIAWLTVSVQTLRAANSNPVDCINRE